MSDDGDKPFEGARGPRKTKPRPNKRRERDDLVGNVRQLFGEEDARLADERLPGKGSGLGPKKDAPVSDKLRKKKRRRKIQIADGWARVLDRVEAGEMTMQEFVKELSPEELVRGRLKAQNGTFVGAPAKWVPADFHRACIRELMTRGKTMYQENYLRTIETMTDLANDPRVDPAQRIRAAQFVIERIEGKVPEKLEISQEQPWQTALAGIVAFVPQGTPMRQFEDGVVTPILEVASERADGGGPAPVN